MLTKKLPVQLSNDEIRLKGQDLSRKLQELEDVDEARKEAMRDYKDRIDALKGESRRLAHIVTEGKEPREVPCETVRNDDNGTIELVRLDTVEVIDSRPMTPEERQRPLPFPMVAHEGEP